MCSRGENPDPIRFARDHLVQQIRAGEVRFDFPLATQGRWMIGGRADVLVTPKTLESLIDILSVIGDSRVARVIIGHGTNLLFDDVGYRGIIVQIGPSMSEFKRVASTEVAVGAGMWVPAFVRRAISHGLSGVTHAIGIPGTVGGLVAMNGGSQRRAIGDNLIDIDLIDASGTLKCVEAADLELAYRTSNIQRSGSVIVQARFRLETGNVHALRREAIAILRQRKAKFPKIRANCGSVFVSDPALYDLIGPPGKAIELVGLKGKRLGSAELSAEHANFIVNTGGASSADVLALIKLAQDGVRRATGVTMATEVRYLEPHGGLIPADRAATCVEPL